MQSQIALSSDIVDITDHADSSIEKIAKYIREKWYLIDLEGDDGFHISNIFHYATPNDRNDGYRTEDALNNLAGKKYTYSEWKERSTTHNALTIQNTDVHDGQVQQRQYFFEIVQETFLEFETFGIGDRSSLDIRIIKTNNNEVMDKFDQVYSDMIVSGYNKPFPKGIYALRVTGRDVPDFLFSIRLTDEQNGIFPFKNLSWLKGKKCNTKINTR